jgi:hypothetical protein
MTREEAINTIYRFTHLAVEACYLPNEIPQAYGQVRDAFLALGVAPEELSFHLESYPHA